MPTRSMHDAPPSAEAISVVVSPMRERHLGAVVANEAKVHRRPWTRALFAADLAQPASRSYLIARVGALVVGHAGVLYVADIGHVTTVVVDPDLQRRQIATRLLAVQVRHALTRGVTTLTLEVRASNTGAQALYRRFGFAPVGARRGYYPADASGPAEDALIMTATDIDAPDALERLVAAEATIVGATVVEGVDCAE